MTVWRIYCNGLEFGLDYNARAVASAIARQYRAEWPNHRYRVRKITIATKPGGPNP